MVKVIWLPLIVRGTDTTVGNEAGAVLGDESVSGALAVKVVWLFEMTIGTDTMGNVLGELLGTLTDTGTSPVKVVWLLDTVIGADTTETVDGVGLVLLVDAD